jgi:hypothetical protein
MSSTNGTSALRVNVTLLERDVVKLDFLQQRELYISMLDIERETGIFQKAIIFVFLSDFIILTYITIWLFSSQLYRHYQWIFF